MRNTNAKAIALGGILGALAVVIMNLGGLVPIATFILPVLCMLLLDVVLRICGERIAWSWYAVVSVLSLLLCPDKEAAAVFFALGYYPILQPKLEKTKLSWPWKALLFNGVILILYWMLMHIFGMEHLLQESQELGLIGMIVTLVLGNICFFMVDVILHRMNNRNRKKRS